MKLRRFESFSRMEREALSLLTEALTEQPTHVSTFAAGDIQNSSACIDTGSEALHPRRWGAGNTRK